MQTIGFATKLVGLTFSIALLAVPAFAGNDMSAVDFHALSGMVGEAQAVPTPLSDEQLASVEGGTHLTLAITLLNIARDLSRTGGTFPVNALQANMLRNFAVTVLNSSNWHPCAGGTNLC